MKIDENKRDQGLSRGKDRLVRTTLASFMLGALLCATVQAATPAGYTDEQSGKLPSNGCGTSYQDGIYLPISQVKHNYVLLLIFDSPYHGITAGEDLFEADDPTPINGVTKPETLSCMPDPDAVDALNRSKPGAKTVKAPKLAMPSWGMVVLGGCPSDCTGPGIFSTLVAEEVKTNAGSVTIDRKISKDPDPLVDMKKGTNWGIMFAGNDDAPIPAGRDTPVPPGVMVWQIRVKDALHAGRILKYLCENRGLIGKPGYVGHVMIGYKPATEN